MPAPSTPTVYAIIHAIARPCLAVSLLLASAVLFHAPSTVPRSYAGGTTTVKIQPASLTLHPDQIATTDILVQDVTNLYGAEVHLIFNPAVVEVVDSSPSRLGIQVQPGNLLSDFTYLIVQNRADNVAGTIDYGQYQYAPAPPVDGSGVLARITWRARANGLSTIQFASVALVKPDGQPIQATVSGGVITVGIVVEPDTPTPDPTSRDLPSPTPSPTTSELPILTRTPTPTPSRTPPELPIPTDTSTPTLTRTPTELPPPPASSTPTSTQTSTELPPPTASSTPTPTWTQTPTAAPSATPTTSPTSTPTSTQTASPWPSITPSPTLTLAPGLHLVEGRITSPEDDVFDIAPYFLYGYYPGTSLLRLGNIGIWHVTTGLRFARLDVPPGAQIVSATLRAYSGRDGEQPVRLLIWGHQVGQSAPFTPVTRPSKRLAQVTDNSVLWIPEFWPERVWVESPDLSDIVQEVVNQPDWFAGNALTLLIVDFGSPTGSGRHILPYEFGATTAAWLSVIFRNLGE